LLGAGRSRNRNAPYMKLLIPNNSKSVSNIDVTSFDPSNSACIYNKHLISHNMEI